MTESRRTVYPKSGAFVPGVPAVPTITDRVTARRLLLSGAFESRERAQEDLDPVELTDGGRAALDIAIPAPDDLRDKAHAIVAEAEAVAETDPARAERLLARAGHLVRGADAQDELLASATPEPDEKPAPVTAPPAPPAAPAVADQPADQPSKE